MTIARRFALAALTCSSLTAFAAPASAQEIDRIVAFGDSYADDGNYFELTGIPPASTTIYASGRFSGGTNYIDTLADILNVPVENFAIAGATSRGFVLSPTLTSFNTNCAPAGPNAAVCDKGFAYQVDQFLNVGTQSSAFPAGAPIFDEGDLVTVSIGANDARYYERLGGTLANAATEAAISVAGATVQLDRLVAAGAPTISFLAGDTSRLPEIAANTTAQAIRSVYSNAFNTGIQPVLAGYAADGVIVHYLDLNLVLDNVAADPLAYGITNGLVCPSFATSTTCVLNSAGYLFYDGLHLTSDGFKIVAQYVATQLHAPLTLQAASDVGMDNARQFGRTLTARMDLGAPRDGDLPEGLKAYIVGDAFSRSLTSSRGNAEFDVTGGGATLGLEYGFGSGMVGVAGRLSRPDAGFGDDSSRVDGKSAQLAAYAGFGLGGAFVQGYVGAGWDDYDIDRRGVVEAMDASTDGSHFIAGAKAGYLFPLGGLRAGPVVALDYAKVEVDGYTENGDPALTLNVDDSDFDSLRGSIGLELRGDFDSGGVPFRPYAALVAEQELSADSRSIHFSQTSAPIIVNTFEFEDVSKKVYGRFTGGLSVGVLSSLNVGAGVSMTFGKDQGNETSGHLGLKLGF